MLKHQYYYFLGIKGVMMANLAVVFKKMGNKVSGVDVMEEFITDKLLKENDISYYTDFKQLPKDVNCLVYAASHNGINNPIAIEAKKRGISILSQAELLGELLKQFETSIAVAGCHGKTTISSMLSHALISLNQRPSYCVGVPYFGEIAGSDFQGKRFFVVEADEYGKNPPQDKTPKFHFLQPDYVICPNIDFDHPDVYKDLEQTKQAFVKFFNEKKLILCSDDPVINGILNQVKQERPATYGFKSNALYQVKIIKTTDVFSQFKIVDNIKGSSIGTFESKLFGHKNILNSAAVIICLYILGFDPELIKKAIKDFVGAKRRFQEIYRNHDFLFFDDYAHHPAEIEATVSASRIRFPGRRLIIVFQPHTYSRTLSLLNQFANSLSKADICYLLPIFASAREIGKNIRVKSEDIAKLSLSKNIFAVNSKAELLAALLSELKKGDVVFTMGAGDVYKLNSDIIKIISNYK